MVRYVLYRVLSLSYLPALNLGLLLAPIPLTYDWQTGSVPAVESWSDARNLATLSFYVSAAIVTSVAFTRAHVSFRFCSIVTILCFALKSFLFLHDIAFLNG